LRIERSATILSPGSSERVVHFDGSDFRVERQIMRAPIVNLHQSARAFTLGPCHVASFAKLDEIWPFAT
jgi:hypothetical protein